MPPDGNDWFRRELDDNEFEGVKGDKDHVA